MDFFDSSAFSTLSAFARSTASLMESIRASLGLCATDDIARFNFGCRGLKGIVWREDNRHKRNSSTTNALINQTEILNE